VKLFAVLFTGPGEDTIKFRKPCFFFLALPPIVRRRRQLFFLKPNQCNGLIPLLYVPCIFK